MAIILYEGFNNSDSNSPKIDTNYWSSNNLSSITFSSSSARTNNHIIIPSFSQSLPNTSANNLVLSNFPDPLATNNSFGLGCSYSDYALVTRDETAPARMKFMEFKNSSDTVVLALNLIKNTYNSLSSIAIEVTQSGNVVTLYDFRSYVGHSWSVTGYGNAVYVFPRVYIEIYIDAKNNKKLSIRVSQDAGTIHGELLNSNGAVTTTIDGFTSLKSITWYGAHNQYYGSPQGMCIDDLYFSRGDTATECYLGSSTRIHRLTLNNVGSKTQWTTNNVNAQYLNLNNADGDSNYAYASMNESGLVSMYSMTNMPAVPAGDLSIIVKPINIVRKTSTTNNAKFINVMNDSGGEEVNLGSEYTVTSTAYGYTDSDYIIINPITGDPWTIEEIDNMQIGIKNLGATS